MLPRRGAETDRRRPAALFADPIPLADEWGQNRAAPARHAQQQRGSGPFTTPARRRLPISLIAERVDHLRLIDQPGLRPLEACSTLRVARGICCAHGSISTRPLTLAARRARPLRPPIDGHHGLPPRVA